MHLVAVVMATGAASSFQIVQDVRRVALSSRDSSVFYWYRHGDSERSAKAVKVIL
jgi:hypothetical protein